MTQEINSTEYDTERDMEVILHALDILRNSTGYGRITIEVRDGEIAELDVSHKIKPKYYRKQN